ncbi:hypothetical protein NDU88_006596 [Pleurodeles waltl]|uniref:Tektin n=1 Tax=Pleurodeles waltl TaxID=8319 RepID=A0AAV7VQB6_PLEWA|nr:hypothetical protein NDU88_006596 [Pleurodeles waltl]
MRQVEPPEEDDQLEAGVEPTRAEILAAKHGTCAALEQRHDLVAIDVNLLRTDLRRVAEKVTTAEINIKNLQDEVSTLKRQMVEVKTAAVELERRMRRAALVAIMPGCWPS